MALILEYLLFLAKTLTAVFGIILILSAAFTMASHRDRSREQLVVRKLNDRYQEFERVLRKAVQTTSEGRLARMRRHLARQTDKADQTDADTEATGQSSDQPTDKSRPPRKRLFVIDFEGDLQATRVDRLREEITAILTLAKPERDAVLVRIDSMGGQVHSYGLAAAQLARLRDRDIPVTACIDKVAASGGYLMAAVANTIVAAPFAIVGSIGVVAQLPNFHRILKKHDIDVELHTAGEYKRTLTVFGENTEAGRDKFREDLEHTHALFKSFVQRFRPELDMEKAATGEFWYGEQALAIGLVDALRTSDALIGERVRDTDVFKVVYRKKEPVSERIHLAVNSVLERLLHRR